MKKRFLYLSLLMFLFFCPAGIGQAQIEQPEWTEKKLGKVIILAEKAAKKRKWPEAIQYGEEVFKAVQALDHYTDARYIQQLKNLNIYYYNAGRLNEISPRVVRAYTLSKTHLGTRHETTADSRRLLYKIFISDKKYQEAIPLVQESLSLLGDTETDDFKKFQYLEQLYSLYGITEQLLQQERVLLRLLKINHRFVGTDIKDNLEIIKNLARNYCLQRKAPEFNLLMAIYNLNYDC